MNFLAHLFLSGDNEDLMIGNIIADFIRNREVETFSPAVQKGIQLHRQIDTYTDQHQKVRQGTHRLQANHRKYAPVVIDIFYDHLLAKNWHEYHPEPIERFTPKVYQILRNRMEEMPKRLKHQLPKMIEDNWLEKYGTIEGMQFVFERMDLRTTFPSNFSSAMDDLEEHYDLFNEEFNQFFPEVVHFVNSGAWKRT